MLDIDAAIKHCLDIADGQDKCAEISVSEHAKERISQCAADHRQLAEWLTELKEAKRLLKAAVEDLSCGGENNKCTKSCKTCTYNSIKGYGCRYFGEYHWRYAAEALALIGEDGEQNE